METKEDRAVQALKAHLALNVENVERSTEFYRKMLGIEPVKLRAGYAKFDVSNPPLNLTLNERPNVQRGAISHLGIQVSSTEDVLAVREAWQKKGLLTLDEMQTNCCYALQDKAWVSDPDGNEWEVFVVLQDNLPQTSSCCAPVAATTIDAEAATTASSTETTTTAATTSCCAPAANAPVELSR